MNRGYQMKLLNSLCSEVIVALQENILLFAKADWSVSKGKGVISTAYFHVDQENIHTYIYTHVHEYGQMRQPWGNLNNCWQLLEDTEVFTVLVQGLANIFVKGKNATFTGSTFYVKELVQ